jgi:hypothetical protein
MEGGGMNKQRHDELMDDWRDRQEQIQKGKV